MIRTPLYQVGRKANLLVMLHFVLHNTAQKSDASQGTALLLKKIFSIGGVAVLLRSFSASASASNGFVSGRPLNILDKSIE